MPLDRCRAEIGIALRAKDLYQIRAGLKNDVFAVLYEYPRKESEGLIKIGATEKLLNTNDPEFLHHIRLVFLFETVQRMKLRFFNAQAENIENENDFQVVGEVDFDLASLFQSRAHGKFSLPLTRNGQPTAGIADIYGEYIHENRDLLQFHLKAEFSKNPNVLTTPSPYFVISKISAETSDYIKVYQSPAKNKTLTPDWGEISVPMSLICNSDFDAPLKFQFYDADNGRAMGETIKSVRSFVDPDLKDLFELFLADGTKTGKIVNNGSKVDIKPTFTEILAETDIQLVVAVDYSFSNGHPSETDSLHYLHPEDPKALNPYEQAIVSVGNIVVPYDSDQSVPLLGFAARVMKDSVFGPIQHCFKVEEHEVHGVKGLLEAYRKSLERVRLHGPTLLNLVIDEAGKIARKRASESEGLSYTILLILTDGEMQDKDRTIEKIVKHSDAPLSIIIVGVKPEDKENPIYDDMRVLDGDQQRLQHENNLAVRDIVQFEAFEKDKPATLLAEKVLQEIPEQMISYFELVKKFPKSFIDAMNSK